jgi:hypothetical protein
MRLSSADGGPGARAMVEDEMQAACQVGDNERHKKQLGGCDVT